MYKKVIFTQFGIPGLDTLDYKSNVPLAAGYLFSYAKRKFKDIEFIITPRVYTDVLCEESFIDYFTKQDPDLALFSLYLWNIEKTLRIVSRLKTNNPDLKVLFGGPEVNPDNELLLNSDAFEAGISGEGELPLIDFLSGVPLYKIAGALTKNSFNPVKKIKTKFEAEDNPYLAGLIEHKPDNTMYFETVRGCPFKCGFCYYNKVYDHIIPLGRNNLRTYLDYARSNGLKEIFLLDPSFNAQPGFDGLLDELIELNKDNFFEFSTELRADLLTDGQINKLSAMNLKEAEIGLQTTNKNALRIMYRSGIVDKTIRNSKKMIEAGINCKIDLIAGLPGDDLKNFKRSVDRVHKEGLFADIQVFRLSVLPGTEFSTQRDKYGITAENIPPYFVKSAGSFSENDMLSAIEYAKDKFDTELFYLPSYLLSTDFGYLRKDNFVHFDSDIKPVHKIIIDDFDLKKVKKIKHLCESLVLHFRITDTEIKSGRIFEILEHFKNKYPYNSYQIILEFYGDLNKKYLFEILKHIPYNESYLDRDASGYFGECEVSTRIAIIIKEELRTSKIYRFLKSEFDVFLKINNFDRKLIKRLTRNNKLYISGTEQAEIFNFLKETDSFDDFTVFDSYQSEFKKFDITGSGRLYFPYSVKI